MSNPDFNFFSAIFPSTADMINSFDWSISDAIDINSISFSKRNKPFLRFLKTFRDAKVFAGGSPEQITHLLNVLQQSIRYFSSDHVRMRDTINVREAEINSLHQQIRNLRSHGNNLPGNDIYFCPICMNGFDSYHTVDKHIEIQHPTLAEKWKEIRHPAISQQKSAIPSTFQTDVQPGARKISQSDVIDAVGEEMRKKLQENSKNYQDLKDEMNVRFQEFIDLLNANSLSSYSSYHSIGQTSSNIHEQPDQANARRKKVKKHNHSKSSSLKTPITQTSLDSNYSTSSNYNTNISDSNNSISNNSNSNNSNSRNLNTSSVLNNSTERTYSRSELSSTINSSYYSNE